MRKNLDTTYSGMEISILNHIFLIQAHKMPDLLIRTLKHLESENHYFIINIDKKSTCKEEFIQKLQDIKNVIKITNFSVAHGGVTQITTTIYQMKYCESYPVRFDYYHQISGQDYPVVSNSVFDAAFEKNKSYSYIQIDSPDELKSWRKTKYAKRLNHYYLHDIIQNRFLHRIKVFSILNRLANKIPRSRFDLITPIWGGWNWFLLNNDAVEYILSYLKNNPELLSRLKYTDCADELIFNTLLMNQKQCHVISNCSFRYIDWHPKRNYTSLPLILEECDYDAIVKSGMLFCRKVELGISDGLLALLDNKIKDEEMRYKNK